MRQRGAKRRDFKSTWGTRAAMRDLCISAKKYFCNDADARRARLEVARELESFCRKVNEKPLCSLSAK